MHYLQRYRLNINCNFCSQRISIRDFMKHLKEDHQQRTSHMCIWCMNYTWRHGDYSNYYHRYNCMLTRIANDRIEDPIVPNRPKIFFIDSKARGHEEIKPEPEVLPQSIPNAVTATHFHCNNELIHTWMIEVKGQVEKQMLGRTRITVDSFYEELQTYSQDEQIFDPDYNLFSKYILEFSDYVYDHWGVRVSGWQGFLSVWESDLRNKCTLLPYWCCCDRGEVHRHMIVRYEKKYENDVRETWRRLHATFRKPLVFQLQLIDMICSVSNVMSQWNSVNRKNCHFNIALSTPPYAELFLSLLYQDGLQFWLHSMFDKIDISDFIFLVECSEGKWRIRVGDLCNARGIVVPLQKYLQFEPLPNNVFTDLVPNTELLLLNRQDWNRHQLKTGNALLDLFTHLYFVFGRKHQEILNSVQAMTIDMHEQIKQRDLLIQEKDAFIQQIFTLHPIKDEISYLESENK